MIIAVYDGAGNLTLKKDRNNRVTAYTFDDLDRLSSENWLSGTTSLPALAVATTTQGGPVNEVQRVGFTASMSIMGGTFTLSFGGYTTGAIAYNASAATVKAALEGLTSIGSGNIAVAKTQEGMAAQEWQLTFQGSLAAADQSQVTIDTSNVSGYMSIVPIQATDTDGGNNNEIQTVTLSDATGGDFVLAFGGETTEPLAYNASAATVESALEALSTIGSGNVSVSGSSGGPWTVTFQNDLAAMNVAAIQGDASHTISGSIAKTIGYTFDDASHLTDVTDAAADYSFGYDDVGRVASITADLSGLTHSIIMAQTFDAASNRTQLAATIGSTADFVDDFTFDNLNRMTRIERQGVYGGNTVAEVRIDLAYNALGQFDTIDRYADLAGSNLAVTSTYGYDNANRLTSLNHSQSTTDLATYDFTWDNANRLTSIDSLQDGVTDYTYDSTNQLTAADFATQTDESHSWDSNGNPTGGSYTVGDNNQVTSDGTYNYTYDYEGNRTRKTKISDGSYTDYVWDYRNRLVEVINKTSGGTVTQDVLYVYDFLNRLISREIDDDGAGSNPSTTEWYAYDGNQIVFTFDDGSATAPDHRYLWGPAIDQLLTDENASHDILYPLGDQVGTLRDIAEYDSGTGDTTVVNHVTFSSFNAKLTSSNSAYDIIFAETGRLHDPATNLDYHLNRWLDANLKRWISEDPLGFLAGDMNENRYVGNAAPTQTDPSGLVERGDSYLLDNGIEISSALTTEQIIAAYVRIQFGGLSNSDWRRLMEYRLLYELRLLQEASTSLSDDAYIEQREALYQAYWEEQFGGSQLAQTLGSGHWHDSTFLDRAIWDQAGAWNEWLAALMSDVGRRELLPHPQERLLRDGEMIWGVGLLIHAHTIQNVGPLVCDSFPGASFMRPPQSPIATRPPLAGVLEGHSSGQGFTGVFDSETGRIGLNPSSSDTLPPRGFVARRGGHATVSRSLGGNVANHSGFAVILEQDGTLRVTWRSGTLNNTPDNLVPENLRRRIVQTIQEQTGHTVSSY